MGQEEVLKAVLELFHKRGHPLTYKEISEATGTSKNSVGEAVVKLERKWKEVERKSRFDTRGIRVTFVTPTEQTFREFLRKKRADNFK